MCPPISHKPSSKLIQFKQTFTPAQACTELMCARNFLLTFQTFGNFPQRDFLTKGSKGDLKTS